MGPLQLTFTTEAMKMTRFSKVTPAASPFIVLWRRWAAFSCKPSTCRISCSNGVCFKQAPFHFIGGPFAEPSVQGEDRGRLVVSRRFDDCCLFGTLSSAGRQAYHELRSVGAGILCTFDSRGKGLLEPVKLIL